jgi:hypothetical protein
MIFNSLFFLVMLFNPASALTTSGSEAKAAIEKYLKSLNSGDIEEFKKTTSERYRQEFAEGDKDHWAAYLAKKKNSLGSDFKIHEADFQAHDCKGRTYIQFKVRGKTPESKVREDLGASNWFVLQKINSRMIVDNFATDYDPKETANCR